METINGFDYLDLYSATREQLTKTVKLIYDIKIKEAALRKKTNLHTTVRNVLENEISDLKKELKRAHKNSEQLVETMVKLNIE